VEEVLKVFQDLIVFESGDDEELEPVVTAIAPLSDLGKLSITLHAAAAFGSTLDPAHFHRINSRIHSDVGRWISHLFR